MVKMNPSMVSKEKIMAKSSRPSSVFLLIFLALMFVMEVSLEGAEGSVRREDCPKECARRCSATSHKKPCLFFCNMCCDKCLCVPSGTYGHKGECPCYNNWKTQRGTPKCP
ncbi:PREDICTED: gibberellin-regulated protein 12 [Nelumbo nucifera]|uniref:Gibberellin-regulated protein 12 n=2 Tax=Nelumbo nucifera TaxID=4432 RepID=A0A1U8Q9S8_NELNU|nr:PREDICTED: gibberellin-regulated protein 12 [Nelumbo nucifera]